jgi:hypothetical protein
MLAGAVALNIPLSDNGHQEEIGLFDKGLHQWIDVCCLVCLCVPV